MSGHSKWATTKHKKAVVDARRGKLFAKLIKNVEVAARKGVVIVPKGPGVTEDDVLGAVLDSGAEEVNDLGESFEVVSEATDLIAVRNGLQEAGIEYDSAEAAFLPSVEVPLDEEQAKR